MVGSVILSVVIPARNEAHALVRSLAALQKAIQYAAVETEVILVDNGSSDATPVIAQTMGYRVLVRNEGSIAALRNAGAQEASGNFLAFLDADCVVAPEWISYCLERLADPQVGAVGTKAVPDPSTATWVTWSWYRLAAGSRRGNNVPWLGTSNLILRRDDFLRVGGFDEALEAAEDVDLCYRLRTHYRLYLEPRINTLHLREVTSLIQLFRKEMSRGQNSLRCLIQNHFRLEDLPSVLTPALNLISMVAIPPLLFMVPSLLGIPLIIILVLPVALLVRKGVPLFPILPAFLSSIVGLVFISARSFALALEISSCFWLKNSTANTSQ